MSKLRINTFKSVPTGWIGSGVMLAFAAIAVWRWSHSGLIFFALTGFRDLLAAWFLLIREPDRSEGRNYVTSLLAYASSALPLMYLTPTEDVSSTLGTIAACLAIIGYSLSTFALLELGSSFGISVATRSLITSGVYRFLRHPMYVGYVIAELGFVFLNPINLILFILSAALYHVRGKLEIQPFERLVL